MTTAHRATFAPAQGGYGKNEGDLSLISKQYSARDLPSHTKLKYRQQGQASADEVKARDFRGELTKKERQSVPAKRRVGVVDAEGPAAEKKPRGQSFEAAKDDQPSPEPSSPVEESEDEEDDEAELLAELARIKAEREAEKLAEEARRQEEEDRIRVDKILHGNPLLQSQKQDFKVQRRWDDDVVFKNCAKGLSDKKTEYSFINDAIRSEFHRKFMEKYIK